MDIQIVLNGEPRALEDGTSIEALVAGEGLSGRRIAVERNGAIVPRSQQARTHLADGDRIEIVHALGGG